MFKKLLTTLANSSLKQSRMNKPQTVEFATVPKKRAIKLVVNRQEEYLCTIQELRCFLTVT